MSKPKYIIDRLNIPYIFNALIPHIEFTRMVDRFAKTAGFFEYIDKKCSTFGISETLKLESAPDDAIIIMEKIFPHSMYSINTFGECFVFPTSEYNRIKNRFIDWEFGKIEIQECEIKIDQCSNEQIDFIIRNNIFNMDGFY